MLVQKSRQILLVTVHSSMLILFIVKSVIHCKVSAQPAASESLASFLVLRQPSFAAACLPEPSQWNKGQNVMFCAASIHLIHFVQKCYHFVQKQAVLFLAKRHIRRLCFIYVKAFTGFPEDLRLKNIQGPFTLLILAYSSVTLHGTVADQSPDWNIGLHKRLFLNSERQVMIVSSEFRAVLPLKINRSSMLCIQLSTNIVTSGAKMGSAALRRHAAEIR